MADTANQAIAVANDAAGDASAAQTTAATAAQTASDAQTTANSKSTVYYGTSQPPSASIGDIWFKPVTGGVVPTQWNGTAWISVTDVIAAAASSAAAAAQGIANTAMTTANGKNTAYYQSATPTGTLAVNDLWFDTANSNRLSVWNGTTWVVHQFGNLAVANLDCGAITTSTLNAARIGANTITADKLLIGDFSNYASWPNKGTLATSPWAGTLVPDTTTYHTSVASLKLAANITLQMLDITIPVLAGDSMYIDLWVKVDTGWNGTVKLF